MKLHLQMQSPVDSNKNTCTAKTNTELTGSAPSGHLCLSPLCRELSQAKKRMVLHYVGKDDACTVFD